MSTPSIHVQRLEARYIVPRAREVEAASVRRRLDRVAAELLARDLERRFAALGADGEAVYFIEQMSVEITLDARSDDHRLAERWARALHEDVLRAINQGGSGIVRFRDRAEFLACFLEDFLRGRGGERWYYDEFAHLRALPTGRAVVETLTADADVGRDALLDLARRGALGPLLAALGDGEVEEVVNTCLLPPGPRLSQPRVYASWVAALRALSASVAPASAHARDVARVYLALLCERPDLGPDVNLARFVGELLRLGESLYAAGDPRRILKLVEAEDWEALGRTGRNRQLLLELVREAGGREVAGLLGDLRGGAARAFTRRASTLFGGLFLLCPAMTEMGLDEFLSRSPYPEPEGATKGALLRYLVGLQCVGAANAVRARGDAGLALFAGLDGAPRASQLERYAEAVTTQTHEAFAREFRALVEKLAGRPGFTPRAGEGALEAEGGARWFSFAGKGEAGPHLRALDAALAPVSELVLGAFAARLGAFAASTPAYLCRNFLESRAEVELSAERLSVCFLSCPLQMVLRMAGFEHTTWAVPWYGGRELEFEFT